VATGFASFELPGLAIVARGSREILGRKVGTTPETDDLCRGAGNFSGHKEARAGLDCHYIRRLGRSPRLGAACAIFESLCDIGKPITRAVRPEL
jgi:hypothetical protein